MSVGVSARLLPVAVAAVTFALATGRLVSPMVALAGAALLVAALIAERHISRAAVVGLVAMCALPVYWGRGLGGFGVALIPATAVAGVLVLASGPLVAKFRPVAIDVAVGSYLVCRGLAYVLNFESGVGAAAGFVTRIAVVYAAFRLITLRRDMIVRLATGVALVAIALSVFARVERATNDNIFFRLLPRGFQADAWARPELRFRALRVEASFGHPIAFGLFLALALVIVVSLATRARRPGARLAWAAGAVMIALALLDTLSRGPLLVAVLAVFAWSLFERRSWTAPRVAGLIGVAALVLIFTPALLIVDALWSSSRGDTREARSAEYRLTVAAVLTDPEQFSLLGHPTTGAGDVTAQASERVGLKSLDNEFALVYVSGGALSLAAFVAVVVLQWRVVFTRGLSSIERAWMLAIAATSLGLTTVALLTQHSDFFWASMGVAASAWQHRSTPGTPTAVADADGTTAPPRLTVAA